MEANMVERRPLIEGLRTPAQAQTVDAQREREFVHGNRDAATLTPVSAPPSARVPISTRIRCDFATALKKASLQRQLDGVEPNTLQDILEQAIEPWLKSNRYLE
jgi:hypothetical protein